MSPEDKRISHIVDAIQEIASGNFTTRVEISSALDDIDGIATGINMLSEEIQARIENQKKENRRLNETISQLKEVRKKLTKSEEIFERIFQTTPDSISISRLNDGVFLEVNQSFERLTGYHRKEIIGRSVFDLGLWGENAIREELERRLRNEGSCTNLEAQFRIRDGSIKYGLLSASLLHLDGEPHLLVVGRDMTEIREAEEILQQTRQKYEDLIRFSPDGVILLDTSGRIEMANPAFAKLAGMVEEEILGLHFKDFAGFNMQDLPSYTRILKQVLKGKIPRPMELPFRRKDGSEQHIEVHVTPIWKENHVTGVQAVVRDITDRKKAEKVRQIMSNISNAVNYTKDLDDLFRSIRKELGSIFDTRNFFIAFYNRAEDAFSLPFFVDEKDSFDSFPAKKTLTGYMIRNDQPILMKNRDIEELVKKGILDDVGTPSKIWLGVPLKIKDEMIGALVMQNYENENAYNENDLEILQFVSSQIGLSIESKRAQDEVQVEKAYFEQLFEGSPETIVLTSNDGTLLKVNSEFNKLFGYEPEEAIGKKINDLIVPEKYNQEAESISDKVSRGEKILFETVRQHKNGNHIHVSVIGTPIEIEGGQVAVYGIYRDITDRKNAEIALRESEEKLRNILYSSPDAITVSDLRGYITECNHAALELFECESEGDLVGKNANSFVIPELRKQGIAALKSVLRKGYIKNREFELITEKKRKIFADVSASLIHDSNNQPIGVVAITQDISARKEYEKELKLAKEKAEESDRLKSAFLANMSHEIRTPMNAILGFSELLKAESLSPESRKEYIKIINNKGNELMLIINDIIDISKIEAGDIKIINTELEINGFLKQILDQFNEEKSLMNKDHIQIRLKTARSDQHIIITDETRLRQILYNLVNNALKFTSKGYVEIGYELSDKQVRFYVKDTGIGISRENQEIVFDRFRQVDESINSEFGGTGLGLSISRNLVHLLGGEIWMHSEINRGSTFYFSLPLPEQRSPLIKASVQDGVRKIADSRIDLKGKKILIAEDDSANYLFLESYLKRTGSKIIWAKDGAQLLELFRSEPSPDLILMDIRMPRMNGIDATRKIREISPDIPVIALTAYAFREDREKSLKAGCNDCLVKPVKLELLSETLRKYLK